MKLTPRQQEILDFIKNTVEVLGAPPTRAEIATAFGFASANAAEDHLKALAKKGAINLEPGSARGIRLVEQLGLPLIGSVAAGSPILAVENVQGRYNFDAGIFDGDLIAVHKTNQARDGEIVVARIDEEVTVKRLERGKNQIRLIAENPDFEPIVINPGEVEFAIEGVAVGLIRGAISKLS